jgi:hypothetical protein
VKSSLQQLACDTWKLMVTFLFQVICHFHFLIVCFFISLHLLYIFKCHSISLQIYVIVANHQTQICLSLPTFIFHFIFIAQKNLYIFLCITIVFCLTTILEQLVVILFLVQEEQPTLLHMSYFCTIIPFWHFHLLPLFKFLLVVIYKIMQKWINLLQVNENEGAWN